MRGQPRSFQGLDSLLSLKPAVKWSGQVFVCLHSPLSFLEGEEGSAQVIPRAGFTPVTLKSAVEWLGQVFICLPLSFSEGEERST